MAAWSPGKASQVIDGVEAWRIGSSSVDGILLSRVALLTGATREVLGSLGAIRTA